MTLRRYQAVIRVEHAHALLCAHADNKIELVATAVGWRSKKDLYRAFRQVLGCTPAEARSIRDLARRRPYGVPPPGTRGIGCEQTIPREGSRDVRSSHGGSLEGADV